jgi:hypothetical protein
MIQAVSPPRSSSPSSTVTRHAAELLLRDCDQQTCAQVAISLAVMLIAVADAPPARIRAKVTEILQQHPPP